MDRGLWSQRSKDCRKQAFDPGSNPGGAIFFENSLL